MTTRFAMTLDINGQNGFGLVFAEENKQIQLVTNTEKHFTVPSNFSKWLLVFSIQGGLDVWVANNHTAELPGSDFNDTFSQLNPQGREVNGGDVISFITAETTVEVGVSLYAIA